MIKREYFFHSKVAHNDGTGNYSWIFSVATFKGWFQNMDDVLTEIKTHSKAKFDGIVSRDLCLDDVEVTAITKV